MSSLKSRLIIFTIQNRHLLKGKLKREQITRETSTVKLRQEYEEGARRFGEIPAGVQVSPVVIPDLPQGLSAEWIHPSGTGRFSRGSG